MSANTARGQLRQEESYRFDSSLQHRADHAIQGFMASTSQNEIKPTATTTGGGRRGGIS